MRRRPPPRNKVGRPLMSAGSVQGGVGLAKLLIGGREQRGSVRDRIDRVIDYYWELLTQKADIPDYKYPPIYVGPTWQITPNGY